MQEAIYYILNYYDINRNSFVYTAFNDLKTSILYADHIVKVNNFKIYLKGQLVFEKND